MKVMARWYFRNVYQPVALDPQQPFDHPAQHHLDSVSWISTWETVCQSTALQMIAAHHGIEKPRRAFIRPDNASYLRETFGDRPDLLQAAARFDKAGHGYQAAQVAIAGRAATRHVADHLRQAAAAERAAGHLFLAQTTGTAA